MNSFEITRGQILSCLAANDFQAADLYFLSYRQLFNSLKSPQPEFIENEAKALAELVEFCRQSRAKLAGELSNYSSHRAYRSFSTPTGSSWDCQG